MNSKKEKLPTLEDFLIKKKSESEPNRDNIKEWMIEFTKMHLVEALKQASEKFEINLFDPNIIEVRENILKSYSLDKVDSRP